MPKTKYHTIKTFPKSNRKMVDRDRYPCMQQTYTW